MPSHTASAVRAACLRRRCLSLAKNCSMGFRSGEYFGRKSSRAPAARMAARTALLLCEPRLSMTTIARLEGGGQNRFHIEPEPLAVNRPVNEPGRFDPVVAERREEGHGVPMAMRNRRPQTLAARRPAPKRRHIRFGPGLVDERQPGRIDQALAADPLPPSARDVGTAAFGGDQRLFL